MQTQKGYVWLIVILVVLVVGAVLWSGSDSVPTDNDSATTTAENSAGESKPGPSATKQTAPKSSVAQPAMTAMGAYLISYTSSGFVPSSISIPRGKSVRIVNNSSSALLVAPVDAINRPYADFRQAKSVGKGGTFDYTFVTPGSYAYFNDNNKSHTAIIKVN